MEFTWLARWQPQLLAILRIVTALLFIEHGTAKLWEFPTAVEGIPQPLPPMLIAASWIEVIAGVLILIGLFTRPAAFIAAGEMAVAYWVGHFPRDPWPVANMGDAAILFCFVFLYFVAAGPGAWSIDGARSRNRMAEVERT